MPARRELTMRQLRQMLRLARGLSARAIGRMLGVARSTVQDNLKRAEAAGLAWPLGAEITDAILEQRLFTRAGVRPGVRRRVEPDWSSLVREAKRPGVNLMVLWEEYREVHPDGYGYSRFCDLFREFERRLSPVMRQHHAAGDKVFVDYSGKKVPIVDPDTGVVREAEIFVAVLGASPHLRRGNLEPGAARLDRGARASVPLPRRRAAPHRARQPEERDPQGLVLRPRDQPQLRHDGGPLRRRRPAGETKEAARQSQGRGRGPLRPDLHPRPAATADVLLARRGQRRDRQRDGAHQCPRHAPSRGQPARALREHRAASPATAAERRLRVCRVAARPGQSRLPRRGRRVPLLRAARPDPPAGRRAPDQPHRRDLPPRPAGRRS